MTAPLSISGIGKSFRGLRAVHDVSFSVPASGIHAVIGPNGAGKTTLFNLIAGVFPPDQVCAAGIGRTFQIVKPFKALTVEENVTIGALHQTRHVSEARGAARQILERLGLADKRKMMASNLTLPDRKRLEVARALATGPKLLLLDEVMAGLRPTETDQMVAFLRQLNGETGLTILLIEHVMRAVMALSQKVVVLHHGEKIAEGTPAEVTRDKAVLEVYLGQAAH
jgi:branched-chain amino acid transport system ATP-binding protein